MNWFGWLVTAVILAWPCLGQVPLKEADRAPALPPGKWNLVFADEFDGSEEELDRRWEFQNGPSGHILCSRWRENARLKDGTLELIARKEKRGGQDWTAASLASREEFQYGYFECRYRYAAATGTNNSFWLMTRDRKEGAFEIDINEGHYPNEINTNTHRWWGEHIAAAKPIPIRGAALADEFHTYGLQWTPEAIIWYFDGREIRRVDNAYCHRHAPVRLSLAIMTFAGKVTDAIDQTRMTVDYVRVYSKAND